MIELKRNQTSDDTVGQLLRYMSIIEEDKKDANVPDGINLIYPANDKDTKKLANFIICYMNY